MKTILITLMTFGFLTGAAQAQQVLVNPLKPYPQHEMGESPPINIYYAGNSTGVPSTSIDTKKFRFINTAASTLPANLIYLDVATIAPLSVPIGRQIGVTLSTNGPGTEVRLSGAGIAADSSAPPTCRRGSTCFANDGAAVYQPGTVLRLAFSLDDLCKSNAGTLCFANAYQTMMATILLVPTLKVTFGVVSNYDADASDVTSSHWRANAYINFGITDVPFTGMNSK